MENYSTRKETALEEQTWPKEKQDSVKRYLIGNKKYRDPTQD